MTMVGGFDVHRKQITFDYVDDDGCAFGEIGGTARRWALVSEHCPAGDAEFALEGCTGWRYVVDELATAGVVAHLGDPAEIAALRGRRSAPRLTGLMRGCCALCCWRAGFRSRGSAGSCGGGAHPGPVVLHADGRAPGLAAAHPRPVVSPGLPTDSGAVVGGGPRRACACRAVGGGTAVRGHRASLYRRADRRNRPGAWAIDHFARRQVACQALQARQYGVGWLCSAIMWAEIGDARRFSSSDQLVRFAGLDVTVYSSADKRSPGHLSRQGSPELRWATFEAASARPPRVPRHGYYQRLATKHDGRNGKNPTWRWSARSCAAATQLRELGDAALAMPVPKNRGWPLKCVVRVPCPHFS